MLVIAGVREAEPWNLTNVVGGIFLLVVVAVFLVWVIRRYLDT